MDDKQRKLNKSRPWILLVGILAALLVFSSPAQAITFGQPDVNNQFPATGAFLVAIPDGPTYQICSGTLIQEQVFLTAAHCTEFLDAWIASGEISMSNLKVSFSHQDIYDPATWLQVAAYHTHPMFTKFGKSHTTVDAAALVLAEPVVGIVPAPLPPVGLLDEMKASGQLSSGGNKALLTAAGYGAMLDWPPPQFINPGGQRWYVQTQYQALNRNWLSLSQNHAATGVGGTCYGDSGGPNYLWHEDAWTPVGITSWGDSPCVSTNVVFRVDIPEVLDFLQAIIDGL